MLRIKNLFKISGKSSIRHIFYSTLPNKPEASDVEAPTKNIEEKDSVIKELLEKNAEQLKKTRAKLRTRIEDLQAMHKNEFKITIKEANARINELTTSLADKEELIAFRDEKIQRLKKELADKLNVIVESEGEGETFERDNEIEASDGLEIRKVKTIVLSNSDKFIEKNEPRIDNGAIKIQNKLKRNAHLFSTKDVKIGYVQNLIDEQTLRRLESRFGENVKNPYKTVNEVVENLQRIYDDSNRRLTAVNSFRDLRMRGNNFIDFGIKFQKFSDDLEYSDDHLLEKFIHKMSSALQKHLSMKCDKAIDLYNLTSLMRKTIEQGRTAENIESKAARYKTAINKPNASERIAAEAKTRGEFRSSSTPTPKVAPSAAVRLLTPAIACMTRSPNPDPAKKKNIIEDRCFNCDEVGHIAKKCPEPKMMKLNEVKEVSSDEENSRKE